MTVKVFLAAPWSNTLVAISALVTLLLLGIVLLGLLVGPRNNPIWLGLMVVLPIAILVLTGSRSVQGYRVDGQQLHIQRPGWSKTIDLQSLQAAQVDPHAMDKSIRIWGNGGLFSFSGFFHNAKLGQYQAYVTDQRRTVVLTFPTRKLVLSPADPDEFVKSILDGHSHG